MRKRKSSDSEYRDQGDSERGRKVTEREKREEEREALDHHRTLFAAIRYYSIHVPPPSQPSLPPFPPSLYHLALFPTVW